MYSQADVIHAMLWPSLVILACGVIFLRLEMQRRQLTWCGRRGVNSSVEECAADGRSGDSRTDNDGGSLGSNSATKMTLINNGQLVYGRLDEHQRSGNGHKQSQPAQHQLNNTRHQRQYMPPPPTLAHKPPLAETHTVEIRSRKDDHHKQLCKGSAFVTAIAKTNPGYKHVTLGGTGGRSVIYASLPSLDAKDPSSVASIALKPLTGDDCDDRTRHGAKKTHDAGERRAAMKSKACASVDGFLGNDNGS